MSPEFGTSSIYVREVIITSILYGFDQKKAFFDGWSWFKFYYMRLALGMNLKLYRVKTKSQKF